MNPTGALVLTGGLGTRLRGVFSSGPKGMAPVNGRPFLAYLVEQLCMSGFRDITFCVAHKAEQIRDFFGDGSLFGVKLQYAIENILLGTAGAIKNAEDFVASDQFFVLNGDSYFNLDLNAMLTFKIAAGGLGALGVALVDDAARYGRITLDGSGRITQFEEKASCDDGAQAGYINAGVYLFERRIFDSIPEGVPVSLEREVLPRLLGDGLFAFPSPGFFIDIGIPSDYERAQTELPKLFRS